MRFCVMDPAKNGKPKQRASCAADKIVILVRLRPLLQLLLPFSPISLWMA